MSTNHHLPVPTPGSLCAIYKPQLALLAFDLLEPDEAAHLRSHLAGCEYCQLHLRQYEIVHGALDRHVGAEASPLSTSGNAAPNAPARATRRPLVAMEAPPHFTLDDIMQAAHEPSMSAPAMHGPSRSSQLSPTQRRFTALSAIAAVLALTVLATSLFAYFGARLPLPASEPTPNPGLDAQSDAYFNILVTYYQPLARNFNQDNYCTRPDGNTSLEERDMPGCQELEATILTQVQALDEHLTMPAPTRWQTADAQFKQANQAMIASFSVAAHAADYSTWQPTLNRDEVAELGYCAPTKQINGDLLKAGFPLSRLLILPHTSGLEPGCA